MRIDMSAETRNRGAVGKHFLRLNLSCFKTRPLLPHYAPRDPDARIQPRRATHLLDKGAVECAQARVTDGKSGLGHIHLSRAQEFRRFLDAPRAQKARDAHAVGFGENAAQVKRAALHILRKHLERRRIFQITLQEIPREGHPWANMGQDFVSFSGRMLEFQKPRKPPIPLAPSWSLRARQGRSAITARSPVQAA
jgi:hypothetical protein